VGDYFYIDGVQHRSYQLVYHEGYFYYIGDGRKIVKDVTVNLNAAVEGFFLENGEPLQPGRYYFDAEGKMVI
jgi:hypothetical protein